jgi:hypothetical protein
VNKAKARGTRSASPPRKAVLRLDAGIYTETALERSRGAFAHLAAIDVRAGGRQWTIRFSNVAPGIVERLPDEFANHALSCLMVEP